MTPPQAPFELDFASLRLLHVTTAEPLFIPLRKNNRSRQGHSTQLSASLLRNNLSGRDVTLPDNDRVVVLVSNGDLVSGLVDHELSGRISAGWGLLHWGQGAVGID